MLAWTWLLAIAVVAVLWLYLYGFVTTSTSTSTSTSTASIATDTTSSSIMVPTQRPGGAAIYGPTVSLLQGTYVGTTLMSSPRFPKAIEAFRGVPYAQDTGGQNRFRPPQPLPKSNQIFDAVAWGKICPNGGVVQRNMSENCLNANIYRPAGLVDRYGYEKTDDGSRSQTRPRLPVVVYVHGGGFNVGHGGERNMASFIAWAKAPMVSVNFNYRVGALGFLPSEVTAREGLLNLGLQDQQMLLSWVQDNIEAFGGDPDNVTIMGLSAGAHSIGHHIMYYSRKDVKTPFVKAILESGATTARAVFYPTHPRHLMQYREFLIAAGADGVPEHELFNHLRNIPLQTIVSASQVVWDQNCETVTWPFQPVIDSPNTYAQSSQANPMSPLIPDLPINSWLAHNHVDIPIITGFNTNEGTLFIPGGADDPESFRTFFQDLIPALSPADLDELESLYPCPVSNPSRSPYTRVPVGMGRQWARLDAAYAHYAYICPVLHTAHYLSRAGQKVYVYRYAATSHNGTANHGDEAAVVAHDLVALRWRPGMRELMAAVHGRWSRFAASGESNPDDYTTGTYVNPYGEAEEEKEGEGRDRVPWPRFISPFDDWDDRPAVGKIMVFGEGNDVMGGGTHMGLAAQVVDLTELEKAACRFWWARIRLSEGLGEAVPGQTARRGAGAKL
ncbi:Alpha/Beta hydrolase protein [Dichotomopilus funicola]|uniref:Carboxylic ester hydrolase n=1 Tax=Dichotomopilus funicola TaxID=1934379 RepID=A0AAN6UXP2_9PEZI|nr:Alpha/Beta hydrolase protein [Dichotomopilus funicola]